MFSIDIVCIYQIEMSICYDMQQVRATERKLNGIYVLLLNCVIQKKVSYVV